MLTDRELNILSLLRIVPEGTGQEELRVGLKYALENRQNHSSATEWTSDRLRAVLQEAIDGADDEDVPQAKKKKKRLGDPLQKALTGSMSEFPASLIDWALCSSGFGSSKPIAEVLSDECLLNRLVFGLQEAQKIFDGTTHDKHSKGYILARIRPSQESAISQNTHSQTSPGPEPRPEDFIYEDFQPFKPLQPEISQLKIIEHESFNKAVDEFFSSIEGQRLESRLTEKEQNAKRKIETARQDYEQRIGGLQQVQELNVRKAQAIEANLQRVHEVIGAVNGLIGQGMDWVEIARLIEMEQAKHNMVAEMIKLPLKLYENAVTVLLPEEAFDDEDFGGAVTDSSVSDSEDEAGAPSPKARGRAAADRRLAIDIDLALSPWSNARQYYDQRKTAASKEQKTLQSSAKALKSTEKKINADLKKSLKQEKQVLRPVRKQLWFEKFHFFISSEGYLVLGGKDAQQNEILYKRYLKKGDVYVHADLHGAASVVVKNKPGRLDDPIPSSTLSQAGSFAVATSSAWDSKAVMSAWWVRPEQVSKTAPTGEYLATGSFIIHGEKNFLPPAHLLLGFGILFRVSEESVAKHLKHRLRDEVFEKHVNHDPREVPIKDDLSDETLPEDDTRDEDTQETANSGNEDTEEASQSASETDEVNKSATELNSVIETQNPLLSEHLRNGRDTLSETSETDALQAGTDENNSMGVNGNPNTESRDVDPGNNTPREAPGSTTSSPDVSSVRHLSARDRRLLRKGQSPMAAAEDVFGSEQDDNAPIAAPLPESAAKETPSPVFHKPHVRGKHGKRAKLKTKYANQDEEDRALALRLLGSAATQKATDVSAAKAAKEDELAAQKQRRRQEHLVATNRGRQEEEIRRMNLEKDLGIWDQGEAEAWEDLEAYIGTPSAGDEILDALVVCGPWDAIGTRCKWRVKMQPGSVKKGKAVREILATWTKAIQDREKKKRPGAGEGNDDMIGEEMIRRREGELLRGLREQEIVGVVPVGNVRVFMGGEGSGVGGKGKRGARGNKKQR